MATALRKASSSSQAAMRRSCSSNCGVWSPWPQMMRKMILPRYQFMRLVFGAARCWSRALLLEVFQFDTAKDRGAVDDEEIFRIDDRGLLAFVFEASEKGRHFRADLPVRRDDDLRAPHNLRDVDPGRAVEIS